MMMFIIIPSLIFPSFKVLKHKQNRKKEKKKKRIAIVKIAISHHQKNVSFRRAVGKLTIRLLLISLIGMYCLPFFNLHFDGMKLFKGIKSEAFLGMGRENEGDKMLCSRQQNKKQKKKTEKRKRQNYYDRGINRFVNAINWMCVVLMCNATQCNAKAMRWQCL